MMFETYYRILKHDSKGKLIKDTGLIPSHSYVIQFLEFIESLFGHRDKTATDVTGAESIMTDVSDDADTQGRASAPANDDTYGIVVGTNAGASSEGNEDYALDTKILNSAIGEAGKLNYRIMQFVIATEVGGSIDFVISRDFINETGNPITVKEVGLICKNVLDTKYHLLLRDVVPDEVVDDTKTLTVTYTLRTTA